MGANQESASERVIRTVAANDDCDPIELPPLYRSVDPDALDTCVNRIEGGEIAFRYAGYMVTVGSDGTVTVADQPPEGANRVDVATD